MADPTAIPIPMEDDSFHTDTSPFCYDPTCFCHEDETLIAQVSEAVSEGLLTLQEASNVVAGKTI